jgi:hypothetical protein
LPARAALAITWHRPESRRAAALDIPVVPLGSNHPGEPVAGPQSPRDGRSACLEPSGRTGRRSPLPPKAVVLLARNQRRTAFQGGQFASELVPRGAGRIGATARTRRDRP